MLMFRSTAKITDRLAMMIISSSIYLSVYMVYQYFQRHVVTAVRVWLVMVTCGRPLVGHSD